MNFHSWVTYFSSLFLKYLNFSVFTFGIVLIKKRLEVKAGGCWCLGLGLLKSTLWREDMKGHGVVSPVPNGGSRQVCWEQVREWGRLGHRQASCQGWSGLPVQGNQTAALLVARKNPASTPRVSHWRIRQAALSWRCSSHLKLMTLKMQFNPWKRMVVDLLITCIFYRCWELICQ